MIRIGLITLAFGAIVSLQAHGAEVDDGAKEVSSLYDELRDISAAVQAGTSFNDYTQRLTQAAVDLDRARRHGAAIGSLAEAVTDYRQAAGAWQSYISAKVSADAAERRGDNLLAAYRREEAAAKRMRDSMLALGDNALDLYDAHQKADQARAAADAASASAATKDRKAGAASTKRKH